MLGIGEELKRIREEKGLSIYDVETETKIKATFIDAIEKENFDKIPGRVYVKGFIKNYAKYLGADYTGYLQKLNQHYQEDKDEDILANSKPQLVRPIKNNKLSAKLVKVFLLLAIVSVLGFGGYKGFEYFVSTRDANPQVSEEKPQIPEEKPKPETVPEVIPKPEDPPAVKPEPTPVTPPVVAPEPVPAEPEVPVKEVTPGNINLEIVMSPGGPGVDSCWIQVIVDGKLEFEQTILAGREPMKFSGNKAIDLTYGNAAAIKIKVNGKDQGVLGEPGEVGTRRLKTSDL